MLCLTLPDFNNILNFLDLRGSELTLTLEGSTVAARDIVSRFTSNVDVILDLVDPHKLAALLCKAERFTIEIEKPYPFHEVLIRPCIELSTQHRYAYTPLLWVGRAADLRPPATAQAGAPIYGVVYEGDTEVPRLELTEVDPQQGFRIKGLTVGAFFMPSANLQSEVERRMAALQRRESKGVGTGDVTSDLDRKPSAETFQRALKSLWPAEALGRLPTYIHLREGRPDVAAFGVDSSLAGRKVAGRLGEIYEEVELAPGIVASRAPYASLPRSSEIDGLAIRGLLSYRAGDWSSAAGWPVYSSPKDPELVVRSNGVVRWMRLGHGLVESIERLSDGRDLALGSRTAMELFGNLAPNRDIFFAGLGLGVVQRAIALDSESVTCEINPAVLDAFRYVYPAVGERLRIVECDVYDYLRAPPAGKFFSLGLFDFFDERDRFFEPDMVAAILGICRVAVISRHIRDAEDLRRCKDAIAQIPFPSEHHVVEDQQLIVAFRPADG